MTRRNLDKFEDPKVLRKLLAAALQRADKERMTAERYASIVRETVRMAVEEIRSPAVPIPEKDDRTRGEEVAVAVLSDWQLAKVTPTYNSKVCEKRIEQFAQKVIKLTNIQRHDHPIRRCHVWCLGDLVEGELIFPGQSHLIDLSLYDQVITAGPRILSNFIRTLLTSFESVHVTVVPGNHGRFGGRQHKEYRPDSNADLMLAGVSREMLRAEPRVSWKIAGSILEGGWYAVDSIGGYKTLLFHGDQIQGGLTTENHVKKLILGWKTGAIEGGFDDAFLGHFHVVKKFTFNSTTVRVAGSPESDNGYAAKSFGSVSKPSQHLQFVRPGKRVTAEYTVWLD